MFNIAVVFVLPYLLYVMNPNLKHWLIMIFFFVGTQACHSV